ncbi:MBL fold metallo-hydrolase [Robertkochia solimangrovi]|uniref:MBL fold metallo-hydrolase n=1 Tax=Robertkochia solimangrovi TaxID=2213046 RepID=UPI00117C9033|nr:MBL fold metallo-hydrolase [Robertkochia solimangrovi]TRZ45114.1 MBL fold metallo-hydrolase [Robertkochia solimangrovi]
MKLKTIKSKIGNAIITQIVETDINDAMPIILPDATPEEMKKIEWLDKPYRTDDYLMNADSQAFFIEMNGRLFVVDTCVGNEKEVLGFDGFNNLNIPFLEAMEQAGIDRTKVTDVICTHLHFDHVGWNTYKENAKWKPTFPNAKYHFAKEEYDYWEKDGFKNHALGPIENVSFYESIDPVVEAGLVNFIEMDDDLGDGISVKPSSGHSKGHINVHFIAGDETFIIAGDMCHHPCQIAKTEWAAVIDYDRKESGVTRRRILGELSGSDILVTCTHFCSPSFGHIDGNESDGFVFKTVDKSK